MSANLSFGLNSEAESYELQFQIIGQDEWNTISMTDNVLEIINLACATAYRWRVRSRCDDSFASIWSEISTFTTLDCNLNCDTAEISGVTNVGFNQVNLTLAEPAEPVLAYQFRIRIDEAEW